MKRLPVDHVDQDQAHHEAERQPDREADAADHEALGGEHRGDLAPRHAEVPQHAELATAREHQRAERRRQARESDDDRDREQRIRHRERAIEDAQRERADLAGRREREPRRVRNRGVERVAKLRPP